MSYKEVLKALKNTIKMIIIEKFPLKKTKDSLLINTTNLIKGHVF